jgi:hypothetical protein
MGHTSSFELMQEVALAQAGPSVVRPWLEGCVAWLGCRLISELHTLHHLGAGAFAWPGEVVQAMILPG